MKKLYGLVLAFALSLTTFSAIASFQGYSGTTNLGVFGKIKCSTGLTCTRSGTGLFTMVSSPTLATSLTLASDEVISNVTDDTVKIASNDETTTLNVYGFEAKNAILELWADEGDDAADKYSIKADTSDVLSIMNNATVLLSFSSAGVQTLADSETFTNASDVITWGFDDAAAEVRYKAFEATAASLVLQADESDDNGDDWKVSSETANTFTISNDTSGTQVAKFTMATTGNVSMVGSLAGDGGDALVGFLQSQITSTTTTLTAAQCGATIVNDSADVLTLPEASTVLGCRYTFVVANASNLDINPNDATDLILPFHLYESTAIAPSAGDAIRSATLGASVTIEAVGANAWAVVAVVDTWADVN